ncbi:prolipoprotein diacylglyceryl transferase [Maridesulfovibrio bastinii]|uniref:prolipoprotein diacylglyceryl transferase n=1 Tax=Maridesulfovibrio bastinii TaxID=47157 RepID=UPI0004042CE2|nr:prolipoprotein diacylglyceryl transferase family protein [Maridesulfovibrio bastinii]
MDPIILQTDNFTIYSYSIYFITACLLGLAVITREARLRGLNFNFGPIAGLIALVCGIIGAKISFAALHPRLIISSPEILFTFSNKTMCFSGALIFGATGASLFLKNRNQSILPWADSFAPAIAIALSVGWLGCFASGFGYGTPTDLPWAVINHSTDSLAPIGTLMHTTQIYYSVSYLIIFLTLAIVAKYARFSGIISGIFITLFGLSNFLISFLRADRLAQLGPLSFEQVLELAFLSIGVYLTLQKNYGSK